MGTSYYIYIKDNEYNYVYYIQLFVNILWTFIFFKYKLLLNLLCCYLNIPYLIWNLFATYLMISIYILN